MAAVRQFAESDQIGETMAAGQGFNQRKLNIWLERAQQASQSRNHFYAHELLSMCVTQSLETTRYTEALLENLRLSTKHHCKMSPARGASHLLRRFRRAVACQDWHAVIRFGLTLLGTDPANASTLRSMAMACESLQHYDVALLYLKQGLEVAPRDEELNRHCARTLARLGRIEQAIVCWHRVESLRGNDTEAAHMIVKLSQDRMQNHTVRTAAASHSTGTATAPFSPPCTNASQLPSRIVSPVADHCHISQSETPRQRLRRLIQAEPANPMHYRDLVEVLCSANQFELAEQVVEKARRQDSLTLLAEDLLQKVVSRRNVHQNELALSRHKMAANSPQNESRIGWLEMLFAAACVVLVVQLMPNWWSIVRANQQVILMALNLVVVIVLVLWQGRCATGDP